MAAPKKLVRDGNVTWQARWRDPSGRQRKKSFVKRSDAVRHLVTVESDKTRGVYVNTDNPTTVTDAAWAWLARRSVRASSRRRLESMVRCHIETAPIGSRRMVAVLPSEVQAWATDRATVLAPTTLRKLIELLRSVYADAVLDRVVAVNPVQALARLSLPSVVSDRVVPLMVAQVLALAEAMATGSRKTGYRNRAMVLVQAGLGLRIGELLGLRVADIDFLRRTVRIEHQSADNTREIVELKTDASRRELPLPQWVADVLAAHLALIPAGHDIECTCPPSAKCSRVASGMIFHTPAGTAVDQGSYGGAFGRAIATANAAIMAAPKGSDAAAVELLPLTTSSHDLRHHFASVLIAAGESVIAVAEWLGHENASLVFSTYGHLMPHSEDRMRKAIDAAYCVGVNSCAPGVPQRSSIKV
jgi:integrase